MTHHHRGKRSIKDSIVQIKKELLDYVTFSCQEPPPTEPSPPTFTSFSNKCVRQHGLRSAGLNTINSKTEDMSIRQRCAGAICAAPQPSGILIYQHKLSLGCAKTTLSCDKSLNKSPDSGIGSMEVEYDSDSGRFSSEFNETDSEMSDVDWTDDESDDESVPSPPSDSKLLNMFSIPFSDLPFVKEEYRRSEISRINTGYKDSDSISTMTSTISCTCSSNIKISKKVQFSNTLKTATWLYF